MQRYIYRNQMLTVKELSEMSGIAPHTLRDRLRRGYSVEQAVRPSPIHDSVEEFVESSHYEDWVGMSIDKLFTIYWQWCTKNNYRPISKVGFSRQLKTMYPQLKTIPIAKGDGCKRIIRMR